MAFAIPLGYRKSKVSTIHLLDETRVASELLARRIRCEYPECDGQAVAMAKSGVAWLMCDSHKSAYDSSTKVSTALDSAVRYWIQHQVSQIALHAYEGQADDLVVTYEGKESLLSQAQVALDGADKLLTQQRRIDAAAAAPMEESVAHIVPEVRPPLATLGQTLFTAAFNLFPG